MVHSCIRPEDIPQEGELRVDVDKYAFVGKISSNEKKDEENTLFTYSINLDAKLHIAIGEKGDMFRYEAIAAGQIFRGGIFCKNDADAQKYKKVIENEILYIGGSRGSGYGRCLVKNVDIVSSEQEYSHYQRSEKQSYLTLYALSNLLLVDENGKNTGIPSASYLEKKLGITNLKLEKSFVSTFMTDGFNHTWKARQVRQTAVKAGSVYVFSYQGKLDTEKLLQLEEMGIGQRKTEGYGRILFNLKMDYVYRKSGSLKKNTSDNKLPLSERNRNVYVDILERIYTKRIDKYIVDAAYHISKSSNDFTKDISLSQISRLYNKLCEEGTEEQKRIAIRKFYGDVVIKKSQTKTSNAYCKSKLHMDTGVKYLNLIIQELLTDEITINDWNHQLGTEIETQCQQANQEFNVMNINHFSLKLKLLKNILYNFMRMEGNK